jgi:F-type H+-transporting ATPase subunit a
MGEELIKAINPTSVFSFRLFGNTVHITDSIVIMWFIMLVIISGVYLMTRNFKQVPKGKQNLVELLVDTINSVAKTNIGHHWRLFAPYLGTVLIYLGLANIISVFNFIPGFELRPPARDVNVTATMAVISILVVITAGIRVKGVRGWIKGFAEPMPIVIPFKIMDYFVRPLSLCFRLFGNMLGGFIIMELLYLVMPAIVPVPLSIYFELFDGILQAYVFVFLTSLYIMEVVE